MCTMEGKTIIPVLLAQCANKGKFMLEKRFYSNYARYSHMF